MGLAAGDTVEVGDSLFDDVQFRIAPALDVAAQPVPAWRHGGCGFGFETGAVGGVAAKIGVDLVQLVVDLLDGAGEVVGRSVGEGVDFPGENLDGVARDGRLEGKALRRGGLLNGFCAAS